MDRERAEPQQGEYTEGMQWNETTLPGRWNYVGSGIPKSQSRSKVCSIHICCWWGISILSTGWLGRVSAMQSRWIDRPSEMESWAF